MILNQGPSGSRGGLRCPIGSTATFDLSSDDFEGSPGDLKVPIRGPEGPWGSIGCLWDPMQLSGWFDESSDDS